MSAPDLSHLAKKVAIDYAPYFQIDPHQQKQQLDFELETVLAQLEEFKSCLNEIQHENSILLEEVPKILTHYEALKKTFHSIDNLENLLCEIKADLNALESAVAKAEWNLKGPSISSMFRPFLFKKDPPFASNISDNTPLIPEIKFKPSKFFSDVKNTSK